LPWDVRTTDLWVHEVDASGNILHSWNILQGQIPEILGDVGYSNLRVDARLKNFGSVQVSARLVLQTVSAVAPEQRYGEVIYTNSQILNPNAEAVFYHWVQMWNEDVYQRLWVDNTSMVPGNLGNCPAGQAPPWSDCRQGELFDYLLSSRHLVYCRLAGAVGYTVMIQVRDQSSGVGIQGATVNMT